jgi:PST family polysaccharide transporter
LKIIPAFIHRRIAHRPGLLKIVDNIGWLFFDKILRMGLGLFVGVWIARYLGPEQFGLFSFATAFVGLFGAVAGLGLQGIVVRDIVRDPAVKEEILGTAAVLQLLGGLLAYGLILGTIFWLRPEDTLSKMLVVILGSTLLLKASDVALYWFESQVLSKYTVWVQNGCFLLFAAIKVALILNHAPLIAFAWAAMAEAMLVALLLFAMLGLRGPGLRQLHVTVARAKGLLKDSWSLLLSGIAVVIYMKIDQIMLGQMVGDVAVGIYSAAVRLSEAWYFVPMVIVHSVFPAMLEAKKSSEEQYYQRLQHLYIFLFYLSVIFSLPLWFFSEWIIQALFGVIYLESSSIFSLYIWNTVFVSLGTARGKWLIAENLQKYGAVYIGISMVSNVVMNYLLIPTYKGFGAACATVVSTFIATIVAPALFQKTRVSSIMLIRCVYPSSIYSYFSKTF